MSPELVALLYLTSGVLFILALRGLSSPETSRQGNYMGMAGMVIAVGTTLAVAQPDGFSWAMIAGGIAVGGAIGATIARRIPMTAMPELVAAFHSLVGMAAVLVAAAAYYAPEAFHIGTPGAIRVASLVEMSLGAAIGAVTFTGSVIAFAKLSGRMSGAPILLPMRHVINIALAAALVACIVLFCQEQTAIYFWAIVALSLSDRHPHHRPHRWRGHARRHLHAELILGMGRRWHRLYPRQHGADRHGCAGWLRRCDPVLHHV